MTDFHGGREKVNTDKFIGICLFKKVGRLQVQLEETSEELSEVSESKVHTDCELIFYPNNHIHLPLIL